MSEQIPLFFDDYDDAIRAAVIALGGFKKVGAELRPELPVDQAGRWLSDCCNPDRRDTLCPKQLSLIRRMAREAGIHVLAVFESRDAGYMDPIPVEPEDEKAALQRMFCSKVDELAAIQAQLGRNASRKRS